MPASPSRPRCSAAAPRRSPAATSRAFFTTWLTGNRLPGDPGGGFWSIDSFEAEPENALIVAGTVKEADAQREAAEHLQRGIAAAGTT